MKKLLILLTILASCSTPKPEKKVPLFKTREHKILECFRLLKQMGEDGKLAGDFCMRMYKEH